MNTCSKHVNQFMFNNHHNLVGGGLYDNLMSKGIFNFIMKKIFENYEEHGYGHKLDLLTILR